MSHIIRHCDCYDNSYYTSHSQVHHVISTLSLNWKITQSNMQILILLDAKPSLKVELLLDKTLTAFSCISECNHQTRKSNFSQTFRSEFSMEISIKPRNFFHPFSSANKLTAIFHFQVDDKSLLARFYHADRGLTAVANELDSFDGRSEPERCSRLVSKLRQEQVNNGNSVHHNIY